jgi:polyketide cyclase/dehydrase/lipid transport protein
MARIEFDMETDLAPERVIGALTDFSDRRPDLWPGLKREQYEVYEVGETSALVKEGSGGSIWAKERYDWSHPGVVRWEVLESGFCSPGSFVQADIAPRDGGGSRIHVTWERRATRFGMRLVLGFIVLTKGAPVRSSIRKGLARVAAQPAT